MITVSVCDGLVESELSSGELLCPACAEAVGPWGWAQERLIHGLGRVRPRRGRCRGCGVTHVLLPVVMFLRRAYAARVIVAVLFLRRRGWSHARIGAFTGIPVSTVRGWVRRVESRLDATGAVFSQVAALVRVDERSPVPGQGVWALMIQALIAAQSGYRARFNAAGPVVTLAVAKVAVAVSHGRLLSPGWPVVGVSRLQHQLPLV